MHYLLFALNSIPVLLVIYGIKTKPAQWYINLKEGHKVQGKLRMLLMISVNNMCIDNGSGAPRISK